MNNCAIAKSILIIDDEKPILDMLKSSLSRKGYPVDTAVNGVEGIRKMEDNEYNLILTDIKMPGISGHQVLEHIRNKINKSIPVVGMSGTPWLLDYSGFDAVLSKPCYMKELLDLIQKFAKKEHV